MGLIDDGLVEIRNKLADSSGDVLVAMKLMM
jgi:hypothetical protein